MAGFRTVMAMERTLFNSTNVFEKANDVSCVPLIISQFVNVSVALIQMGMLAATVHARVKDSDFDASGTAGTVLASLVLVFGAVIGFIMLVWLSGGSQVLKKSDDKT